MTPPKIEMVSAQGADRSIDPIGGAAAAGPFQYDQIVAIMVYLYDTFASDTNC